MTLESLREAYDVQVKRNAELKKELAKAEAEVKRLKGKGAK